MILSEKIMLLRKQNGWSQEELAEKLGISRQSVSKWESTASLPDLDKIIKMSEIFGVSTDYLLKDDLEEATPSGSAAAEDGSSAEYTASGDLKYPPRKDAVRSVSLEEANAYLELVRTHSVRIAPAVFLLVCSPICLIIMSGLAECRDIGLSENIAGGLGVVILLVIVALAVILLILSGFQLSGYDYLEKEPISLEYGVSGIVEMKKKSFEPTYRKCIAIAVPIFILGVVPLMLSAAFSEDEMVYIYCLGILLFLVACGASLCTWAGMIHAGYSKLLQAEDYSPENKAINKRLAFLPGLYWCAATAIYLGISFSCGNWERSWIVWPVAAVLYAAVYNLAKAVAASRN